MRRVGVAGVGNDTYGVHMTTDTVTPAVAQNVRTLMDQCGETFSSLERGTGLSRSSLRRRITGTSPWLSTEMAIIAAHFGTTAAELVTTKATAA